MSAFSTKGTVDKKFGNSGALTKNYLKTILPRFVSKECGTSNLKGMDAGLEVSGPIALLVQNVSAPPHPALAKRACQPESAPLVSASIPERAGPQTCPKKPAAPGRPMLSTMIHSGPTKNGFSFGMSMASLTSGTTKFVTFSESIAEKSGLKPASSPLEKKSSKHEKTKVQKVRKDVKRPPLGEIKNKTETSQQNIPGNLTTKMTKVKPNYNNLKVAQLKDLLREKGLKVTGNKAALVERLKEKPDYEDMKVVELKDCLRGKGLKLSGNKADLIKRLVQFDISSQ